MVDGDASRCIVIVSVFFCGLLDEKICIVAKRQDQTVSSATEHWAITCVWGNIIPHRASMQAQRRSYLCVHRLDVSRLCKRNVPDLIRWLAGVGPDTITHLYIFEAEVIPAAAQ